MMKNVHVGWGPVGLTRIVPNPTQITLKDPGKLEVGSTTTLEYTANIQGDISWQSSNYNVATIDKNGQLTAVGAGTVTITLTITKDGKEYKDTKEITVKLPYSAELKDKLANCDQPGDIELKKDVVASLEYTCGNQVTLNLKGKTLTGDKLDTNGNVTTNAEEFSDSYGIWVKKGEVTITGDGVIEAQECKYSMAVWANGGTVNIESGTFINHGDSCDLIYASNGSTVKISGGYFEACGPASGTVPGTKNPYSALNIKDKDADTTTIIVTGGIFKNFNPANNLSEGPNTTFINKDKYVVVKAEKTNNGWQSTNEVLTQEHSGGEDIYYMVIAKSETPEQPPVEDPQLQSNQILISSTNLLESDFDSIESMKEGIQRVSESGDIVSISPDGTALNFNVYQVFKTLLSTNIYWDNLGTPILIDNASNNIGEDITKTFVMWKDSQYKYFVIMTSGQYNFNV